MRLIEQQDDHLSPKFLNCNWLLSDRSDTVFSKNRPLLLFEVCDQAEAEEHIELCIIQVCLFNSHHSRYNKTSFTTAVNGKIASSKIKYERL